MGSPGVEVWTGRLPEPPVEGLRAASRLTDGSLQLPGLGDMTGAKALPDWLCVLPETHTCCKCCWGTRRSAAPG